MWSRRRPDNSSGHILVDPNVCGWWDPSDANANLRQDHVPGWQGSRCLASSRRNQKCAGHRNHTGLWIFGEFSSAHWLHIHVQNSLAAFVLCLKEFVAQSLKSFNTKSFKFMHGSGECHWEVWGRHLRYKMCNKTMNEFRNNPLRAFRSCFREFQIVGEVMPATNLTVAGQSAIESKHERHSYLPIRIIRMDSNNSSQYNYDCTT